MNTFVVMAAVAMWRALRWSLPVLVSVWLSLTVLTVALVLVDMNFLVPPTGGSEELAESVGPEVPAP